MSTAVVDIHNLKLIIGNQDRTKLTKKEVRNKKRAASCVGWPEVWPVDCFQILI